MKNAKMARTETMRYAVLEDCVDGDGVVDVVEDEQTDPEEQADEPCLIYGMVIRVIAVYDLLDLIQTVGADLAGIRAKVEDDEIEDRESRKAADEPFARIEFRSLASYIAGSSSA